MARPSPYRYVAFTFLGVVALAAYYPLTHPLSPSDYVLGATATPTPQMVSCESGFSEDFNSSSLNTNEWSPELDATGKSAVVAGDHLTVTADGTVTTSRVFSRNVFHGDFVAEVDIPSVVQNAGDTGKARFKAQTADSAYGVVAERDSTGALITYPVGGSQKSVTVGTAPNVRFQIVRTGKDFKVYYKTTGTYTLLGYFPGETDGDVRFELDAGTTNTIASFDNFSLRCLTNPAATAPRSEAKIPSGSTIPSKAEGVEGQSHRTLVTTPSPTPSPETPTVNELKSLGSPIPSPAPVENHGTTPTNPMARFFLWLASLFEK